MHYHRFHHLGPFDRSVTVIFQYLGPDQVTLHFHYTEDVPGSLQSSENNCLFKIPEGYTAEVEVCEVSMGPGKEGRFVFNAQLHATQSESGMGSESKQGEKRTSGNGLPVGECTGTGDCRTSPAIECRPGLVPWCDNGTLKCKRDERDDE